MPADGHLLRAAQLRLGFQKPACLEVQLREVQADRQLETRVPRRPLRPGQCLSVRRRRGGVAPQVRVQQSLLVQHARHLVRRASGLEALACPPQELAGGGEIALLPCQHAQLPLQPTGARRVARGLGESESPAVPRLGAAPLSLRECHVAEPLGRRGRPRLIELGSASASERWK